jgi:hypothetical protein
MAAHDNVVPFRAGDWDDAPRVEEFRPRYASQLEGTVTKAREWLIDGVLMRGTVSMFAGAPKIGKSLVGQQALTALALGEQWLGRATLQTRAFGLYTEDPDDELDRRQRTINGYYHRSAADFELELSFEARHGKDALLVEFERFTDKPKFTPLWHQIWNYVAAEGIGTVYLDPLSAIYGGNLNFPSQVSVFMRALTRKAVELNLAVLLSVHPPKSNMTGYAGATTWLGASRLGMWLGRPPEYQEDTDEPRDDRILRSLGANYVAGQGPQRVRFVDGVFDLVEEEHRPQQQRVLTHTDRAELRYRLLAGVKRVVMNGGRVPADELHKESMPNRARRSPDTMINRVAFNDLYVEQQALIDSGQLVRVDVAHKCLLRPADGPYYAGELPWLPDAEPGKGTLL